MSAEKFGHITSGLGNLLLGGAAVAALWFGGPTVLKLSAKLIASANASAIVNINWNNYCQAYSALLAAAKQDASIDSVLSKIPDEPTVIGGTVQPYIPESVKGLVGKAWSKAESSGDKRVIVEKLLNGSVIEYSREGDSRMPQRWGDRPWGEVEWGE